MSLNATIQVPQTYGYVMLTSIVAPFVANMAMGSVVMKARKACDVQYPNLYGTPGFHKKADEFNRAQRGHQSMFESMGVFIPAALVAGLHHPIIVSVGGIMYSIGNILFQNGYADTSKDAKVARYTQGGQLKMAGLMTVLGCVVSMSGHILGWW